MVELKVGLELKIGLGLMSALTEPKYKRTKSWQAINFSSIFSIYTSFCNNASRETGDKGQRIASFFSQRPIYISVKESINGDREEERIYKLQKIAFVRSSCRSVIPVMSSLNNI